MLEEFHLDQDSFPDPKEIMNFTLQGLPSPRELSALYSFQQVHFPVTILRDTLQFYEVYVDVKGVADNINLSGREKDDKLNAFLFICGLADADYITVQYVIEQYRLSSTVGSAIPTPPSPTVAGPSGDPATQQSTQDVRTTGQVHVSPGSVEAVNFQIPRLQEGGSKGPAFRTDDSKKAVNVESTFKDG